MKPKTMRPPTPTSLKGYAIEAVHAGLDVELPWALCYGQLESLVNSQLTDAEITDAATRVLEQKLRFKADKMTGKVGIGSPITKFRKSQISCNGPHLALAEKAAIESMVLLKNDNNTLPIPSSVTKLAVVGATVPYETDNGGPIKTGGNVNFATDVRTATSDRAASSSIPPKPSARSPASAARPAARSTEPPAKIRRRSRVTTATNNVAIFPRSWRPRRTPISSS